MDDSTIMITAARLQTVRAALNADWRTTHSQKTGGVNSLLFYLVNTLQLCLQRIEDADTVLCGSSAALERSKSFHADLDRTYGHHNPYLLIGSSSSSPKPLSLPSSPAAAAAARSLARRQRVANTVFRWARRTVVSAGVGAAMFLAMDRREPLASAGNKERVAKTAGKIVAAVFSRSLLTRRYDVWRLHRRIEDSTQSLSMWQQKWIIVTSVLTSNQSRKKHSYNKLIAEPSPEDHDHDLQSASRKLLEAMPMTSNKGAFWYSQGALRLLLVRHVMDLVYASVGTAMAITGPAGGRGTWIPLTALCAAYYTVVGPGVTSVAAAGYVARPDVGFVKRAWGMVSAPPIKW